jgi:nucleotide-binding universal stress UspA family protein
MKPGIHLKKIIWSVDPFEDEASFHRHAAQALGYFADHHQIEIQPVYVLDPAHFNVSVDLASPWVEEVRPLAEKELKNIFSRHQLPHLKSPLVIPQGEPSISEAVDALTRFSEQNGADLILVNSHGRSGIKRLLQGSFAETLFHRSSIPVMIVGEKSQPSKKLSHILFPTEFGEHSKDMFRQTISVARDLGARITLFHALPRPEPATLDFNYNSRPHDWHGEWVTFRQRAELQLEHQTRRVHAWAEWATHEGIAVETVMDTSTDEIDAALLKLVKAKQIDLVMMEAQSDLSRLDLHGSLC